MSKSDSFWPLLYVGVAVFGAFGGYMFAIKGPTAVPTPFLIFAGLGCFVFTAASVYGGLSKRLGNLRDRSVLDVSLWSSSPINPQSNRLAQAIFFASIGIVAIFESRGPFNQSVGFFPLSIAIGVATGMLIFRFMYWCRLRQFLGTTDKNA